MVSAPRGPNTTLKCVVVMHIGSLAPTTLPNVASQSLLGVTKTTRGQKVMEQGRVRW